MIGFLGETWLMLIFCTASKTPVVSPIVGSLWLAATLSPLLGLFVLAKRKWESIYVYSIGFTLFVFWLIQFLVEVRVTYCDAL